MNQTRLYGGKPLKQDRVFSTIDIKSRFLMIDSGLSYALAPLEDILQITHALRAHYGVECHQPGARAGESSQEARFAFFECVLRDSEFHDLPNI